MGDHANLLSQFEHEMIATYRGDGYRVRDNGAVCRQRRPMTRKRPLDEVWTFGVPNASTGYMHIGPEVVHRIVATAFHGEQPSDKHIVDHIDTNRRNNRAENLRWITRLDNILLNPVTRRRIEIAYGSIETFFENPRAPVNSDGIKNFEWMRTVTKEEAEESRARLQRWAASDTASKGGMLGEWVFGAKPRIDVEAEIVRVVPSLTPNAIQRNWRTPSTFEQCPDVCTPEALTEYARRLTAGSVFARNDYGDSLTVIAEQGDGFISIVSNQPNNSVKGWAVAKVTIEDGKFLHEAMGTYFTPEGAEKKHCGLMGRPFEGETFDDFV
ncbi:MAG: HNH endonuclease [Pseudorhodoplanes sp.]|nr:HNH endonuclease [Pseudorhodoplanes sp.]